MHSQQYGVIMTSNSVIVSVKLCLNVGNNDYITLCKFGDRIMGGRSKQKKAWPAWIGLMKQFIPNLFI